MLCLLSRQQLMSANIYAETDIYDKILANNIGQLTDQSGSNQFFILNISMACMAVGLHDQD